MQQHDYSIITVSDRFPTEWYFCPQSFYKSLSNYGINPLVLTNEKMGVQFTGLGSKPNWQCRAIKEKMFDTKYAMLVDSWDLFFAEHPDRAFEKYLSFNSPIVLNAEVNCFPGDTRPEYDKLSDKKYRYLNSGVIIGETDAILAALEAMGAPNIQEDYRKEDGNWWHQNDQGLWLENFLKQPVKMSLDYKQEITQTLHDIDIDEFEFTDKGIRNKTTGSYPSIFHANGSGKSRGVKEPILEYLKLI